MALTSNETSWATTIVMFVISSAFGSFLTYITIKAQHAKSMEEVQDAVKNIIARLALWLSNLGALTVLVRELISPEPVSRKSVFMMVWMACILVTTFLFSIIMKVMKALLRSTEMHSLTMDATTKLTDLVGDIVRSLPCNKPSEVNPQDKVTIALQSGTKEKAKKAKRITTTLDLP
jgi:hypothetical protein